MVLWGRCIATLHWVSFVLLCVIYSRATSSSHYTTTGCSHAPSPVVSHTAKRTHSVPVASSGRVIQMGKDFGRGGPIRTDDPLLPKQMRYQAAPRPDLFILSDAVRAYGLISRPLSAFRRRVLRNQACVVKIGHPAELLILEHRAHAARPRLRP